MPQVSMVGYAASPRERQQLQRIRTTDRIFWFPDNRQRVFVDFNDRAGDGDGRWVKTRADTGWRQQLSVAQVLRRLRADTDEWPEYEYQILARRECIEDRLEIDMEAQC